MAALVLGSFLLLALPFIPFLLAYNYLEERQFQRRYQRFLLAANGTEFFCYNNRKSSVAFAQEQIVPLLEPAVRVVFVEGSAVRAGADKAFISRMLAGVQERKGFPYLLKIVDGQVLAYSVNNQFYNCLVQHKPLAPLLATIHAFYQSPALFLSK
ncbi:hypothetical protein LJ737_11855 [Hymenobacter sp. 15J16-1T3B]|nr:hypothetical protein [Hymenobacter sp. 15J16-1T3B]